MKKIMFMGAALALVLSGAGCNRSPVAPVTAPTPKPAAQAPADTTGVDAATDDLINVAADEDKLIKDEANDAQELGDDQVELNAITESSYELR
jgi:hypothetical protein